MPQNPLVDANQYPGVVTVTDGTGAFVERFIGAALLALGTQNSGPGEPSPTYAYMVWADSSAGTLKIRNAGNTAWVAFMNMATGAPLVNAPTATTLYSSVSISLTGTVTGQVDGFNGGSSVAIATIGGLITGMVLWFPASTAPSGFLPLSGGLVSRGTYSSLWTYAQGSGNLAASDGAWDLGQFSPGDGSTTFRIPDLRGVGIRGWDNGKGTDTGRAIGTYQADEFKNHQHKFGSTEYIENGGYSNMGSIGTNELDQGSSDTRHYYTLNTATNYGGTETRMKNVALLPCIKY